MKNRVRAIVCGVLIAGGLAGEAGAHCDTMDGPVVKAAREALGKNEPVAALAWVQKADEPAIREAFGKTIEVRKLGGKAQELADMYFFETLVRIHRAGEGAPYTGLKPAGTARDPIIEASDKALETGSADALIQKITGHAAAGIRERFNEAMEKKKTAATSVEAGREFVEAYVKFVHYAAGLHKAVAGSAAHEGGEEKGGHED